MTIRPFTDDRLNVDALHALLRTINVPKDHTGQLVLHLHFISGALGKASFELHNVRLGVDR